MYLRARKLIAVLMLLWLPLFSGNALAASLVMQMPQGQCHEEMAMQDMAGMDDMAMTDQVAPDDQHGCSQCGICHLACSTYLAAPVLQLGAVAAVAVTSAPYLVSFHSITSAPLVPPPLVRA